MWFLNLVRDQWSLKFFSYIHPAVDITPGPAVTGLVWVLTIEIYPSQGRKVASQCEIFRLCNLPGGLLVLALIIDEQASKSGDQCSRIELVTEQYL